MNKLIAAIEALPDTSNVEAYPANYDSDEVLASFAVFDEMPTLVNAVNDHETLTAKIEALEDKLAVAERLINEINDARAANWHLQRRRENDQFEWFSSTADSVFGPFPTALEAFAAVRKENTDA